jgi:hypothetical protein
MRCVCWLAVESTLAAPIMEGDITGRVLHPGGLPGSVIHGREWLSTRRRMEMERTTSP